jgi:hypothetical protein
VFGNLVVEEVGIVVVLVDACGWSVDKSSAVSTNWGLRGYARSARLSGSGELLVDSDRSDVIGESISVSQAGRSRWGSSGAGFSRDGDGSSGNWAGGSCVDNVVDLGKGSARLVGEGVKGYGTAGKLPKRKSAIRVLLAVLRKMPGGSEVAVVAVVAVAFRLPMVQSTTQRAFG